MLDFMKGKGAKIAFADFDGDAGGTWYASTDVTDSDAGTAYVYTDIPTTTTTETDSTYVFLEDAGAPTLFLNDTATARTKMLRRPPLLRAPQPVAP
jgi:hypothetical protein